jgi:hypothetical protein
LDVCITKNRGCRRRMPRKEEAENEERKHDEGPETHEDNNKE